MLFEKCSGSDGLLGRAELSEVLWQDLQVLREEKRGSTVDGSETIHPRWCRILFHQWYHQKIQVQKKEVLNLIGGCFGGGVSLT